MNDRKHNTFVAMVLAIAGLLATPGIAQALSVISVDFTAINAPNVFAPADSFGVVPAANWNNIAIGNPTSASAGTLKNDAGVTHATLNLSVAGSANTWNRNSSANGFEKLYDDFIDSTATTNINDIGFAKYDLYLYLNAFPGGGNPPITTWEVFINNNLLGTVNNSSPFPSSFILNDNYAVFAGLTADDLEIRFNRTAGFHQGLSGFQIVEVAAVEAIPEPASMVLVLVAGGALMLRRRQFLVHDCPV